VSILCDNYRAQLENLDIEIISQVSCQLQHILMPVFSGCGVDTRINNLNTYLLDIAIDKKKYDPIRGEFTGAFENKLLKRQNSKLKKQDSIRSNNSQIK